MGRNGHFIVDLATQDITMHKSKSLLRKSVFAVKCLHGGASVTGVELGALRRKMMLAARIA